MPRIFGALLLLAISMSVFAGPITGSYYDPLAFDQAVAGLGRPVQVLTDNFATGSVSLPGVSVSSDINFWGYDTGAGNGHFVPGAYTEFTGKYTQTVWHFAQPVYSFGGFWQLGAVNAGLEVDAGKQHYFLPDGLVPANSWYSASNQWSGFWGFVSSAPVDTVTIRSGDESFFNNSGQTYKLTSLQVATVMPEPGSVALGLLGLALIGAGAVRRSRKAGPRESR